MDNARLEAAVQKCITVIDEIVTLQLNIIIQYPDFKALESLWAGCAHLVESCPAMAPVVIRFMDMSWKEIEDDLTLNATIEDSHLYRLINRSELSTLGGSPFGLMIVEHTISVVNKTVDLSDDIYTIELLSELGQSSLCPMVMPASHDFLATDKKSIWEDISGVQRILDSDDYKPWRKFQSSEPSRFFGLTIPRVLLRHPRNKTQNNINFNETSYYYPDSHFLWGSSALIFAESVIKEFNRIHWFGFLRAADKFGGATVKSIKGVPIATSIRITDELEKFYTEQGFIPLSTSYLTNDLMFNNNRSAHLSGNDQNDDKVLLMLQTILMGCRFAHYLKALIREHIGSYRSAQDCQKDLNAWLQTYTSELGFADDSTLAKYPLKYSKVEVTGNHDLGIYQCEVEIQPQYQFDSLEATLCFKASHGDYLRF
ncbi:type VI secretion system contractile sheath domain-containing protein [Candidatus Sororendozoicomonas aggregata]|uniref:type VI secretion system contractile sheath domain-containing protein n=1 Tax=Candidatus Sororendozoicomonas aggregata TaxID=3073239 RepID=UPI002ED10908